MGRKPIFDRPMSAAERQRRSRQAKREGVQLRGAAADPTFVLRGRRSRQSDQEQDEEQAPHAVMLRLEAGARQGPVDLG